MITLKTKREAPLQNFLQIFENFDLQFTEKDGETTKRKNILVLNTFFL